MEEGVKLNLNKLQAHEGKLEIIYRDNEEPIKKWYDKAVNINGTISAAGNYYDQRKDQLKDIIKKSHIVYDYRHLFLKLVALENHDINAVVNGKLTVNPDIAALQINTKNKLTSKELVDLLKFNRFFFADKDECQAIIGKLMNTKIKVIKALETVLNNGNGNERDVYDRLIEGVDKMAYVLQLPIYTGQTPVKFEVVINIDARDKEIVFWLESTELAELKLENAKTIIDNELSRFEDSGLVMIEQ